MVTLTINGVEVSVERGSTVLEAAQFFGFPIPPSATWRVCRRMVRAGCRGRDRKRLANPARDILHLPGRREHDGAHRLGPLVRTRRMIVELLLGRARSRRRSRTSRRRSTSAAALPQEHETASCAAAASGCARSRWRRARSVSGPGLASRHRDAVRRQLGEVPAVRRLHVRLPGLRAALHLHERTRRSAAAAPTWRRRASTSHGFDDMMCFMSPCVCLQNQTD